VNSALDRTCIIEGGLNQHGEVTYTAQLNQFAAVKAINMNIHYETLINVNWGDSDPFGLVYFPRMMSWFNDTEHELFRRAGYPVNKMVDQDRTAFVMGKVEFRFEGPAAYGDRVIASIDLEKVGNSTMHWRCKAIQEKGGAIITQGMATRIYAEIMKDGNLASRPIPEKILEALRDFTAAD
jgi:4-hydroxybenzoyl-CoA thioesterase